MSGLFLLGLFALWLFAGWVLYRFWRYMSPASDRKMFFYKIIGIILFSFWFGIGFWYSVGKKLYYDAQVRYMCEKDGGVVVYETVELSADKFDKYGNLNLTSEEFTKPSVGYYSTIDEVYIKKSDPTILKFTLKIYRKKDKKVLGKAIRYGRGGGDLPGFWHPSSYGCPPVMESIGRLESLVFKKGRNK
ncbi:MAG: hypothetical protein JAZ12_08090 [Candidatus Thiodiazotropha taylori]|nr:hypothetical protein [Candidatus Thiodiazotropha taylori]